MWWYLGSRGLTRVMSLQAMGWGQRLPASYWRLGKTPLQVCRERSTAETLISESSTQTDRVYCHKYPICGTLSLNSTKPSRCVLYKFYFSFKMKAKPSSQRSQGRGLYTVSTFVRLWLKNGAEVSRHEDSFGQNKTAVWEKGDFTLCQALLKPQWKFLI